MKAIVYNINAKEKELLVLANYKRHDITIISNSLAIETLGFAAGKHALVILDQGELTLQVLQGLKNLGIKLIVTTIRHPACVDPLEAANGLEIVSLKVGEILGRENMDEIISQLDLWSAVNAVPVYGATAGALQ